MLLLSSLTILVANAGAIFAQASAAAPDELGGWLAVVNIGLAGIGLVAFIRGWIVAGYIHEQSIAREATKQAEIEKLRAHLDEVIEELIQGRHVQAKMVDLTDDFLRLIEDQKRRDVIAENRKASS